MCLALSNNDAQKATNLFWEMPLVQLFAFAHAYMQNNGVKTRPLSSKNLLSQIFGGLGKKAPTNDKGKSEGEWFDEELGEVEYIR
jgi:hypothetical protein